MLGRVGVHHLQALLDPVDQDDAGLAAGQRGRDPVLDVLGGGDLPLQFLLHRLGEVHGVGDQDGGGQRVVLGLADQVGGDVHRVGGGVGEDGDLGGAGLRVDADAALEQALGRGDPDVAGAGDHAHRTALLGAVGEHRDGLGAARGVHLVDAEQRARGEDRRVREPAELLLRRRGHGHRADLGLLRGHHVHHHGGRVDRASAGNVQTDPLDRHPALGDRAARHDLRGVVGTALLAVDEPGAADRLLQRGPHLRVQLLQGPGQRLGRDAYPVDGDAVELLRVVDQCRGATMLHVLADRAHRLQCGLDVELGPGQQVAVDAVRREGVAAQIDSGDHPPKCREPPLRARPGISP